MENSYCRLCAVIKPSRELNNLQNNNEERQSVIEKLIRINATTPEVFNDENLPQTICFPCLDVLNNSYEFVTNVENAQITLSYIFTSEIKNEVEVDYELDYDDVICNYSDIKHENSETDGSNFPSEGNSNSSRIFHEQIKLYKCRQCKKGYATSVLLRKHKFEHNSSKPYKCDQCNLTFRMKSYLNNHKRVHLNDYPYSCDSCNKNFKSKSSMKRHDCGKDKSEENELEDEKQSDGKRRKKKYFDISSIPAYQLQLSWKDYKWSCAECLTTFQAIDELMTHSITYHKICNSFKCTDCNIRKLRFSQFIMHVKNHRQYLKLSCFKCNKRFATPYQVHLHESDHMKTEFVCPGCTTEFSNADEYNQHVSTLYKRKRSGPVPTILADGLTCLECKRSFATKTTLHRHLTTHTDRQRDFICHYCGKGFMTKSYLVGHMFQHEKLSVHKCKICNKIFPTPSKLRKHVGTHSGVKPFVCDQCGRCFRLQSQLYSHSIVHTDCLPYVCSFCNKGFRFKSPLNEHVRLHTGLRPYKCDVCDRDFSNWPNYNKHMKRRHGRNMAKKKHTPDGVCPVDSVTGEIIKPVETSQIIKWKKQMNVKVGRGRPRLIKGPPRRSSSVDSITAVT